MGGGWLLDFTRLMQSHLPTKVEVEVEDELGKKSKKIFGRNGRKAAGLFIFFEGVCKDLRILG